jgi:hypothetical protein
MFLSFVGEIRKREKIVIIYVPRFIATFSRAISQEALTAQKTA